MSSPALIQPSCLPALLRLHRGAGPAVDLFSSWQGSVFFNLIHDDLAMHAVHRPVRQENIVYQRVQRCQVRAVDAQEEIGSAGQCPSRYDFRLKRKQLVETGSDLWVMRAQLDLNKRLNVKPHSAWIELGAIPLNNLFRFEPLSAAGGLAGAQAEPLGQFLCGKLGVFLKCPDQLGVSLISHGRSSAFLESARKQCAARSLVWIR